MRIRVLLAGVAVAIASVVAVSAPAGARPAAPAAEGELSHESEECIELLEKNPNKSPDACQEAPSPILPPINELVWGSISFIIVFGLLWKLAFPGIKKGMEGRTERIRGDLAAAEAAKVEATEVLAEYQSQLADARNESARIIEEARRAADEVKQTLTTRAESEIAEQRARASAEIESAKVQAIADLRGEVANLAIGAAEEVVQRSLDRDTSVALVEAYIDQVGADR